MSVKNGIGRTHTVFLNKCPAQVHISVKSVAVHFPKRQAGLSGGSVKVDRSRFMA